ncbi:hypothetical protein GGTG_10622 [Gaeumannomyces tritici R3-111a-1]|uniref:Uncharacterized protein n=1 Tax=Gaeumannomyces tritici (strain R3-111a-1) TaxID=644352 RepID=J3PAU7_GAET3|nr:hypothetical protein GGTG_10622 [Gaeumannomyces tritici R3-111a-1]EJT71363.1 hypothetical protein GGTG_10622 [Gaeumannomyces tritici R3-111a-1]
MQTPVGAVETLTWANSNHDSTQNDSRVTRTEATASIKKSAKTDLGHFGYGSALMTVWDYKEKHWAHFISTAL